MSERVERARDFARRAHGDQRYGTAPYVVHLDAVAALAAPYGEDAVVIAYLHDVVEDTSVTLADIEREHGARIAQAVGLVTDEAGANRRERKMKTYAKLAAIAAGAPLEIALVVKICDRLANVRSCVAEGNDRLLAMYRDEHPAFVRSVFRPNLAPNLQRELDALLR